MLLDEVLPEYQISAVYAVKIQAPGDDVYRTILHSPFMDSTIFKVLMRLRELPSKLFSRGEDFFPQEIRRLDDFAERGKFVLLGKKENEELVFGLIGRFWDVLNTGPKDISSLGEFRSFNKSGYGKAAMNFYLEPVENGTKLYTETRVYFSDNKYLKRFKVYWFFIGFFSGLIRKIFLKKIKASAEQIKL